MDYSPSVSTDDAPATFLLRHRSTDRTWRGALDDTSVLPGLPDLQQLQTRAGELVGEPVWILSFHHADPLEARFCTVEEAATAAGPEAGASITPPWSHPAWYQETTAWIARTVGPHRLHQHRVWGRSTVLRVEAEGETLWFKESYGLPPGEGAALSLASRTRLCVPEVVAAEGARALMGPLAGVPLEDAPPEAWGRAIAELVTFQREADPADWLAAGCRDLRAVDWGEQIGDLLEFYGLPVDASAELASRFAALWQLPAVVHPQDLGPCNLRWLGDGVQAFDWSDVVIGPPGMLLDRFTNECAEPGPRRGAVTRAWMAAWGPEAEATWQHTRRCALLLEVLRYHTELSFLAADSPLAAQLRRSNARQLQRQLDALRA